MQHTIGFLVYEGIQVLDLAGPHDAFGAANDCTAERAPPYNLVTIGLDRRAVRAESGLTLTPDFTLDDAPAMDTLVLPGGRGSRVLMSDRRALDWIRARAVDTRRIAAVCTGIYMLAATGVLDGRRATTHWAYAADVGRRFPAVRLNTDQLYIHDPPFHTSGGLTAGLDLALALIEDDLGGPIALSVARRLVMYVKRPGNQAQFSEPLQAQSSAQGPLASLPEWLLAHLAEDLPVSRMAAQVNMSERNFSRAFRRSFRLSPSRFLERLRLEHSRLLLTSTQSSVERIATAVGFDSADAFRRVFRRLYGASPREYRERFGQSGR